MIVIKTCLNCQERHIGCHSHCERYQEAVKRNKLIKRKRELEFIADFFNFQRLKDISLAKAKKIKAGRKK